jgi:hypothetical protein
VDALKLEELPPRKPELAFEPGSEQAKYAKALDEALVATINTFENSAKEPGDSTSAAFEKKQQWDAVGAALTAFVRSNAPKHPFLAQQAKKDGKTS